MDKFGNRELPMPMSRKTRAKIQRKKATKKQALSGYTDEDLALIINVWRHELDLPPC